MLTGTVERRILWQQRVPAKHETICATRAHVPRVSHSVQPPITDTNDACTPISGCSEGYHHNTRRSRPLRAPNTHVRVSGGHGCGVADAGGHLPAPGAMT